MRRAAKRVQKRFRKLSRARVFAALAACAFLVAVALVIRLLDALKPATVTISAGNDEGRVMLGWMSLDCEAPGGGLFTTPVLTEGSLEMLEQVDQGKLDFAFVQGGFDMDRFRNVRQVAGLSVVPLILLVKEELHSAVIADLGALRGKTVNLGSGRSTGTYWLSRELLSFSGLKPTEYTATHHHIRELRDAKDRASLPDAIFLATRPPSPVVPHLATEQRYRIVPLPYGEAFRQHALAHAGELPSEGIVVRQEHVPDAVIPAFAYGVSPAIPPQAISTVGTRILLVTHQRTRPTTVIRVLETLFDSRWAKAVQPPLDREILKLPPELPLHSGAAWFRDRDQPLVTADSVSFLSNALQIVIPVAGGLLFLRGWLKNRRSAGREQSFDQFLALVSEVERQGAALCRRGMLDHEAVHGLNRELSGIKESAFHYVAGQETSPGAFAVIVLAHISDVRAALARMRIEEQTAKARSTAGEDARRGEEEGLSADDADVRR